MDNDYYEEFSNQEEVVPEAPPVAGPVAVVALPNVEVQEVPDNPDSPSPALSDDGELFTDKNDWAELQLLRDLMERTRFMRGGVGYLVVEPLITEKFKGFLRFLYGSNGRISSWETARCCWRNEAPMFPATRS